MVELERAGLAGGITWTELVWFGAAAGEAACVGVGRGLDVALEVTGCGAVVAVWGCPSSPGANERVEQNPSDELMINVRPSPDLRIVS